MPAPAGQGPILAVSPVFHLSTDILCILDSGGSVRQINAAAERLLGYSRAELEQRPLLEFVHRDDRVACTQKLTQLKQQQATIHFENRLRCKNGSYRRLFWQAQSAPAEGAIYAAGRDVPDNAMERVAVLAGGIAHQFNNLLTGVLGNASLALEMAPSESRPAQLLEEVIAAANRAADLTRQLLAYAGKGQVMLGPVSISSLVGRMLDLLRASIPGKVELRAELTADIPDVEADEAQIQQMILNLVINAGEAIDGSGAITIRTGTGHLAEAQAIEECHAELASGDYVLIEVADTGSGMDAETRSRIFDPFFSTKFTGRGLGLAAVAGIARSHGGAVQVSSEPGRGSTFRVLLPAVSRPVASQPASARPVSAQRSR